MVNRINNNKSHSSFTMGKKRQEKRLLNSLTIIFNREMTVKMNKCKLNNQIEPNTYYDKHSQINDKLKNEFI